MTFARSLPRAAACLVLLLAVAAACTRRVPVVVEPVGPMRTEPLPPPTGQWPSDRFGSLFCSVLAHKPDEGTWDFCDRYFSPTGTPGVLPAMPAATHRLLVLPGIFGQCVEGLARPYSDAARHMRAAHQIDVEYLSVSALGSAEFNADQIAEYLRAHLAGPDSRPYVVIGYSKGASDVLEAVARHDVARNHIAAVVTVAGSVLGSRLAEDAPRNILQTLRGQLGTCGYGDRKGLESLRRADRVRAMGRLRLPTAMKFYSIPAISTETTTSFVLRDGWRRLQAYSLEQDSQMIHEDAIVPGAAYLGYARADHWAVALPFEHAETTPEIKRALDRLIGPANHYPRAALFESIVRYVLADLASQP